MFYVNIVFMCSYNQIYMYYTDRKDAGSFISFFFLVSYNMLIQAVCV